MSSTSAIILCGGMATRMGDLCKDVAKAMMPVCGKPFLCWLVENLLELKIPILLSAGKHTTDIHQYFDNSYWQNLNVKVLIESSALGTGGAIRFSADFAFTENFVVLNADTILSGLRLKEALTFHNFKQLPITQVLSVSSNQNTGKILVEDGLVVKTYENNLTWDESTFNGNFSSTGVYIFEREFVIDNFPSEKCSLEIDLLPEFIKARNVSAWIDSITVTDFGTPERYGGLSYAEIQVSNMFQ